MSALLLFLFLLLPARAEDQAFTYTFTEGGRTVGHREVHLRYLPGPHGEVRLLHAYTEFSLDLGPRRYDFSQRVGARLGGNRSFTASVDDDGRVREVQAFLDPDGRWSVTLVEAGGARTWSLDRDAVDLSSAELLDPERAVPTLSSLQSLHLLVTETGAVLEGPVEDLGPGEETVAGQSLPVHLYRFSPPQGEMILAYDADGFLVSASFLFAGRRLRARLDALPPPRSYDTVLGSPLTGEGVQEEELR